MSERTSTAGRRRRGSPAPIKWLIAVVVTVAAFMEILDTTIVNVSLPPYLGQPLDELRRGDLGLTSYLVANGIVLTISGWLGRVLGRKRYFLICLAMFTVCALLCGFAEPAAADLFRTATGLFRRRPAAQPAVDHARHFPPEQRAGLRAHGDRDCCRARARADAGRLDHRQLQLAMDLLHQYSGRRARHFAVFVWSRIRPGGSKPQRHIDFIGLALITLGLGCLQVMLDRGEDRRLVRLEFHPRLRRPGRVRHHRGASSGSLCAKHPMSILGASQTAILRWGRPDLRRGVRSLRRRSWSPAIRPNS